MTDATYYAKKWLMRTDALEQARRHAIDKALLLESKVNHCTASAERSGRDAYSSMQMHDNLFFDYVNASEQVKYITERTQAADFETVRMLEKLRDPLAAAILIDRYVNRLSWAEILKVGKYDCKKSTLYRIHSRALETLGAIVAPVHV